MARKRFAGPLPSEDGKLEVQIVPGRNEERLSALI